MIISAAADIDGSFVEINLNRGKKQKKAKNEMLLAMFLLTCERSRFSFCTTHFLMNAAGLFCLMVRFYKLSV